MKTLNSFFLSSLCMLISSSVLAQPGAPTITTEATTVQEKEGSSAVLKCRVSNLNSRTVTWTFVTQNLPIFNGRELVTNDPIKYSIITPQDTLGYDLMLLTVEKSDHGFYRCAINGTDLSVTILLEIEDKPIAPFIPPDVNHTDCCVKEGVEDTCLEPCNLADFNATSFNVLGNCEGSIDQNILGLTKCLTANSNHDNCCLFSGLPPICLPFCHNDVPEDLETIHALNCLNPQSLNIFVKCFGHGYATLPDAPRAVTVLPSSTEKGFSLIVSWEAPLRNPDKVTGYQIMYRREDKDSYYSHVVKDANANSYRLTTSKILPNMQYDVYVAALADQGVSLGSTEVSVFVQDETLSQRQNQLMSACCAERNVNEDCNNLLCHSRTWAHFDFDSLSQCSESVNDIFSCLLGERNHRSCCRSFGVSPECHQLCTGNPPPFNESYITCMHELGIIEACVQQGYDQLPTPPTTLRLIDVTARSATFTFVNSSSTEDIRFYQVQLHEGLSEEKDFQVLKTLTRNSLSFSLKELSPDTYYGVRILTVNKKNYGSLPSDSVYFLTYPASFDQPTPPPVVNVPSDLKACCESKGMPKTCSDGCQYVTNMTKYFEPVIHICYSHIGTVLSCAADGRDHSACCAREGLTHEACLDLCRITQNGPLPAAAVQNCITATPTAVACYIEGITYLPRHPDVVVSNVTWHSISLVWEHPNTSSPIDVYIVEYKEESGSKQIQDTTNKTHYILNDLKPNTGYEITVSSRNDNGTSARSPLILVYTLKEKSKVPEVNYTRPTGDQLWSNITHCCTNSGIPRECIEVCLNQEVQTPDASCIAHRHNILACYADGQDHSECCARKSELPEKCHALCKGQTQDSNHYSSSCMSYGNHEAILSCFLENADLIPEAPTQMSAKEETPTSIKVKWVKPIAYCGQDCISVIYYWKFEADKPEERKVLTIPDVESPHIIKDLDSDAFYTVSVRAKNSHGTGPPSNLETIFLSGYDRIVRVSLRRNEPYVEKGQSATLECAAIDFNPDKPYTVKWFFNNGREIVPDGANKKILVIPKVDPDRDEGIYSCLVTDSVRTSSDALFLPIKFAPTGAGLTDNTVQPAQGMQATVECWFKGFPDTDADQWQKDGTPLSDDSTKYSAIVEKNYETGITIYRLKVANVAPADYGDYSIEVSNTFGQHGCTVRMQDPDDISNIVPAKKVVNARDCCIKNGVTEKCTELCGFDIDVQEAIDDPSYIRCLFHFEVYIKCGTDGQDHTKCCKDKGINPYCLPFCAGKSPGNVITEQDSVLDCVTATADIFECAQSGHKILPYPPRNLIVSWWANSQTIMVRWSRPLHNHDRIEHYIIHYTAGNGTEKTHMVNEQILEYEIKNPDREKDYSVHVTAANKLGASQDSEVFLLEAIVVPPPSSLNVAVNGVEVTLTWDNTPAASSSFERYHVYYKMATAPSYDRLINIREPFCELSLLEANTKYMVYVTTLSTKGHESQPSVYKQFTTGASNTNPGPGGSGDRESDDDDDDKIAIGVGVVVALFAVAAIIFLVVYLVKSRRMNKYTNDTVAFENSAYGIQGGSVKIHGMETDDQFGYGRLAEDRVLDNPTSTLAEEPSGAYANPTYAGEGNEDTNVATLPVSEKA